MTRRRILWAGLLVLGVSTLWFLGVDRSWYVERCEDCGSEVDILQYRVFSVPISETRIKDTCIKEMIADDLGVPCPHKSIHRWHKERWWGLCFCAMPCHQGMLRMGMGPDEQARVRAQAKQLAARDPELAEQFRRRVLIEHDQQYWRRFLQTLSDDAPQQ